MMSTDWECTYNDIIMFDKCPCELNVHSEYDEILTDETKFSFDADSILNESSFCTSAFPASDYATSGIDIKPSDFLKRLKDKMGLYHLWVDKEFCEEHDKYLMESVYVGKGKAQSRISDHMIEKWPTSVLGDQQLFISFFPCENRVAKYLEQLFMDLYNFTLNTQENPGEKRLLTSWDHERHALGTEFYETMDKFVD